jgi:hypothetical protein
MTILERLRDVVIELREKQKALADARAAMVEAKAAVREVTSRRDKLLCDVGDNQAHLPFRGATESEADPAARPRRRKAVSV